MTEFRDALVADFDERLRFNEPLARHTTFRLGGPAEVWLAVRSVAELVQAVTLARQYNRPVLILGGGANLLISDAGIQGLVLQNRANRVKFGQDSGPTVTLTVDSGVVLPNLARRCAGRSLSGLEWAVGVPGTVGGAIVNNAGAYGQDMARSLIRAELLSPTNERVWRPVEWFEYSYRTSRLKGAQRDRLTGSRDWIVLQAELRLAPAPAAEIRATLNQFNERRKASQPPGATIGSMFKNPPGDYAGRLIEAAGLKGYCVGQAQISPVHANFFQNLGGATAKEVLELIETARTAVQDKFGVVLELEIEVVGEFG